MGEGLDPKAKEVGQRLKSLRKTKINPRTGKPYTLEQAAVAVGITYHSIQQYERGRRIPLPRILERLAAFYGVSTDFILTGLKKEDETTDEVLKSLLRLRGLPEDEVEFIMRVIELRAAGRSRPSDEDAGKGDNHEADLSGKGLAPQGHRLHVK